MQIFGIVMGKSQEAFDEPMGVMCKRSLTSAGIEPVMVANESAIVNFAEARNRATKIARDRHNIQDGDWLFYMDLDERVVVDYPLLVSFLNNSAMVYNYVAFRVEIVSPQIYKTLALKVWKSGMVRLVRNDVPFIWEGELHETIVPSLQRAGWRYASVPSDILHIAHIGYDYSSWQEAEEKAERNIGILKSKLSKASGVEIAYHIGNSYMAVENWDMALCYMTVAMDICSSAADKRRIGSRIEAIRAVQLRGKIDGAHNEDDV